MRLTNNYNLPLPLVHAVENDDYERGTADFTASELSDAPQPRALQIKHWNELEEDVTKRLWSLMGQATHAVLERAKDINSIREERMETTVTVDGKQYTVSGKMDRLFLGDDVLQDYKQTGAFAAQKGLKPEWVRQLNILAAIMRDNGHTVNRAEIVLVLRDWMQLKARTDRSYPQQPFQVIPCTLFSQDSAIEMMRERIRTHVRARSGEQVDCSPDERWATPEGWAVMKKGGKRALKVCSTKAQAEALVVEKMEKAKKGEEYSVEHRPGQNKRCEDYCIAQKFCSQYKRIAK